ncbi:MAG: L,D-transpeptidase [Acidobacteriia bacterium]|nr:L,D-transpeptidase [Terriglobia bacterium]
MRHQEIDFPGGSLSQDAGAAVVVRTTSRMLAIVGLLALVGLIVAAFAAAHGTGYTYGAVPRDAAASPAGEPPPSDSKAQKRLQAKLESQHRQLETALQSKVPKGIYVVVDQTQNRIYLKKDEETLLNAACSAGSGLILKEGDWGKGRKWVFDTPRGLFKVKSRQENPVWKKPDWAFVEEGKPIPKSNDDRMDYGTLGEYSFQLGDGYMIHGTLYERLLGRSVTHGCIRVGRDDLRKLWKAVQVGTPVYIY